ncbi:unnamed protein product [Alternaria burnsii]|nr:unnamed protein product [Alternaria burnsii]
MNDDLVYILGRTIHDSEGPTYAKNVASLSETDRMLTTEGLFEGHDEPMVVHKRKAKEDLKDEIDGTNIVAENKSADNKAKVMVRRGED